MKAELVEITEEMTNNEELTKALNDNFNTLNEAAHNREMSIFSRLSVIQKTMDNRFDGLNSKLDLLLQNAGVEAPKNLLTDNSSGSKNTSG